MDADRFDTLSRTLTTPGSRRTTLRALGALALGGGVAASLDEAEAGKCGECKRKKNGRCKKRPDGTFCSVGKCRDGRCGCATVNDCYEFGGDGSDGQVCQESKCVCTAPGTSRCLNLGGSFGGACGECCSFTCPGGRICNRPTNGPWRCFCNGFVAVDCEQVCIPKECDG